MSLKHCTEEVKMESSATLRRNTPPGNPKQSQIARPKKSTYLGMLLFLQENKRLGEGQIRFVLKLQQSVKFTELERALKLLEQLKKSPRSAARARVELERIARDCPFLEAKSTTPEKRRIGVGYRDKGALRMKHEDHYAPPRMWWSEDIKAGLLNPPEEARWISAEELFGMDRYEHVQELALLAVLSQTQFYQTNFRKAT